MSHRRVRAILAALAVCAGPSWVAATEVVTTPYPGIKLIQRTDQMTNPTRQVKMNIVVLDLNAPEIHFKMTPPTPGLPGTPENPTPAVCVPQAPFLPWPCPAPAMEVVRRPTLGALEDAHAQVAINGHFFAPFPTVNTPLGQAQAGYAYLIGLAASRGNVYSAFETPVQNYAIVADAPAVNIDPDNFASIVHRDPSGDGTQVLEPVTLWNAIAGSGQIITNGIKTIPCYLPLAGCSLVPPGNANYSNANSWYNLINARSAIGISQDGRTLYLFTADVRPNPPSPERSQGMRVPEVADVLLGYGVYNALNLDGGGSTSMAMQDTFLTNNEYLRHVINVSSDNPPRSEASNLAVYSDGIDPVSTAATSPLPNANGWNKEASVTVSVDATDLRSGNAGSTFPGFVDQVQYSTSGAQTAPETVAGGATASVSITTEGITTVTYSATDAAGNREGNREQTVRMDRTRPEIAGLPSAGCSLWPPNHEMRQVALVTASDALSGVGPGGLTVTATASSPSDPDDVLVEPDGAGGFAVWLRAERRGNGRGREYTISATATDLAGNVTTATATCVVPHDQGNH